MGGEDFVGKVILRLLQAKMVVSTLIGVKRPESKGITMQILSKITARLVALVDGVCTFLMLILLAVISYQVFARYVLNNPPSWSEELAKYLIVWVTMLGSAVLVNKEGHISVDFLVDRLPQKIKQLLSFIRDALTIFLCASLAYYGYQLAILGGRATSTGLEIKMFYPYLSIPCGSVMMALVLLLSRLEPNNGKKGGLNGN